MSRKFSSRRMVSAASLLAVLGSGCARYHPVPLPAAPDLTQVPSLTVPASTFWLPGLAPHAFPKNGLDETAVVTLAVFEDPDLKAARLQEGVAGAQLLQAGLLPNPQLGAGFATSAINYGYSLGIGEDIQALITRGAARAGAGAHRDQVHLDILWQEWQVAEKARELFIQSRSDDQLRQVLLRSSALAATQYRRDKAALEKGDATSYLVSADLAVLVSAEASLRQLQTDANLAHHQLNHLLGLQPEVQVLLIGPCAPQPVSQDQFRTAMAALPQRRADLLALAAGYESQEQNVRQAILAQFPAMRVGLEQGRDPVEGINYFGPNISMTLPLFDHNQAHIAEQRATRAILRQTYQARLDQAASDANQVRTAIQILDRQLRDLDARLPVLQKTAASTEQSFRQGNLDAGLYVSVESSLLATQAEEIRLRASLDAAQSAFRTLLALPFSVP